MAEPRTPMPDRRVVDPAFDGHAERPLAELTADERIAWIWAAMKLLRAGRRQRGEEDPP